MNFRRGAFGIEIARGSFPDSLLTGGFRKKSQVIFLRKTGAGVHIRSEEMRLLLSRHEYFGMPLQQPVKRGRAALPPPHDKEIRPAHNVPSKVGWMFSRRRAERASRMLSRTALEPAAMAAPSMSHFGTSAA